jgi:hypothetical protein
VGQALIRAKRPVDADIVADLSVPLQRLIGR